MRDVEVTGAAATTICRVQSGTARRERHAVSSRLTIEASSNQRSHRECRMNLVVLLIILFLLFGGGGFYVGGPLVGGSLGGLILLVLIVMLLTGRIGSRA